MQMILMILIFFIIVTFMLLWNFTLAKKKNKLF